MPYGGPAVKLIDENDEYGEVVAIEPNAVFHDRDGKVYPCVIEKEYPITIQIGEAEEGKYYKRTVCNARINFAKPRSKNEDWKSIAGLSLEKAPSHLVNKSWVEKKAPKEVKAKA